MSLTVLVFTDGRRDCISRTIASFLEAWDFDLKIDRKFIINDSADPAYAGWLDQHYSEWDRVHHETRRGFGGAIQSGWNRVHTDWVFHLEDDFLFGDEHASAPICPLEMIEILQERGTDLVQMALKRQPWNDQEKGVGDLMRVHPSAWEEMTNGESRWCEQRMFFTTNPSIYRGELTKMGWPQVQYSEGVFSHQLMEDPNVRFGMMGHIADAPRVFHIGNERVGSGY